MPALRTAPADDGVEIDQAIFLLVSDALAASASLDLGPLTVTAGEGNELVHLAVLGQTAGYLAVVGNLPRTFAAVNDRRDFVLNGSCDILSCQ
ncbi:hypothetical protein VTJ04DRAFT_7170 [Mycothermus thermophilus]|uniref:uncharacterized protein n=1 Tax=Humicola insolens TaxID=85995 RepID=UPI003743316F